MFKNLIRKNPPLLLVILLLACVLFIEVVIMQLLKNSGLSFMQFSLIDAGLLIVILFPSLYFAFIKPFAGTLQEFHKAEFQIRKSEEKYRNIFENVQEVYYEVSLQGEFLELSPSIKDISRGQYERSDLLGTSVYDLYARKEDRESLLQFLKINHEVRDHEITLKNRDGSLFLCSVSARLFFNEQNIPEKITGIMRDVSARKLAEQNMKLKNEELSAINSEKDKLFSIIAHDLRSPFNAFIGLTEIMVRKSDSLGPEDLKRFAASMHSSAINLYSLLENLLLWSRTKQGTMPFNPVEIPLYTMIRRAVADLRLYAEKKHITVDSEIPKQMIVSADENAFQFIVRNLLSNALKFTPQGGKITLSAKMMENRKTEIICEDTGIGMDEDMITKLFLINGKVNRLGTEGESSSGLGLIICREFVEKHGGTISVSSVPEKGSKFSFII